MTVKLGSTGNVLDHEPPYYQDRGCGGSCVRSLECPLPKCIHDMPNYARKERTRARNERIRAELGRGSTTHEVAAQFGLATRTILRVRSEY